MTLFSTGSHFRLPKAKADSGLQAAGTPKFTTGFQYTGQTDSDTIRCHSPEKCTVSGPILDPTEQSFLFKEILPTSAPEDQMG